MWAMTCNYWPLRYPWLMITGEKACTDLTVVIAYQTFISFPTATSRLLWQGASYLRKRSITSFILCPHFHYTSKRKKKKKTQIHSNITAVTNYTIKKKMHGPLHPSKWVVKYILWRSISKSVQSILKIFY